MMIHDTYSIPLPVSGDCALHPPNDVALARTKNISSVNLFTHTCELFDIIGDILSTLYCNNGALIAPAANQRQHVQSLSQIMALNGRLEAYLMTLSDPLRTFIEGGVRRDSTEISNTLRVANQAISCRYDCTMQQSLYQITDIKTQILIRQDPSSASSTTYTLGKTELCRRGSGSVLS